MRKRERKVRFSQRDYRPFWNPETPCGRCGVKLGQKFAPVRSDGTWHHYDCCLALFAARRRESAA